MKPDTIECAFAGCVGKDPELRTSQAGKPWCSFAVAVGQDDATQWVRVALFGEKAEEAARTIAKGDRVHVEGRLKLSTWEKDGEARHGLEVAAWLAQPLGKIGNRKPEKPKPASAATVNATRAVQSPLDQRASLDDPIPFRGRAPTMAREGRGPSQQHEKQRKSRSPGQTQASALA